MAAIFDTESEAEGRERIPDERRESRAPVKQRAKQIPQMERAADEQRSMRQMVFQSLVRGVQTSARAAHLIWQQPMQVHIRAAIAIMTIQRTALLALLRTIRASKALLEPLFSPRVACTTRPHGDHELET